ncbi:MAG TPA: IS200/IS605 family transposase [Polyangiaceae bacterium]|jgi:REP element-mobilizing transposase RayT
MNGMSRGGDRRLWVQLVWATRERERLLPPGLDEWLERLLVERCEHLGCAALAVGAASDHVHVLVAFRASLPIATIAQELKGPSSRALSARIARFGWEAGYYAETVGDAAALVDEVRRQRERHEGSSSPERWEAYFEASP